MQEITGFLFLFIGGQFVAIIPTFLLRLAWDQYMRSDLFYLDWLAEKLGAKHDTALEEIVRLGVLNQIVLLALAWPFIND